MISIGNPWIFREIKHYVRTGGHLAPPSLQERVDAVKKHLLDSVAWKGHKLGVLEMRRHYTNYFRGMPGIKQYRARLVQEMEVVTLLDIIDEIADRYAGSYHAEVVN